MTPFQRDEGAGSPVGGRGEDSSSPSATTAPAQASKEQIGTSVPDDLGEDSSSSDGGGEDVPSTTTNPATAENATAEERGSNGPRFAWLRRQAVEVANTCKQADIMFEGGTGEQGAGAAKKNTRDEEEEFSNDGEAEAKAAFDAETPEEQSKLLLRAVQRRQAKEAAANQSRVPAPRAKLWWRRREGSSVGNAHSGADDVAGGKEATQEPASDDRQEEDSQEEGIPSNRDQQEAAQKYHGDELDEEANKPATSHRPKRSRFAPWTRNREAARRADREGDFEEPAFEIRDTSFGNGRRGRNWFANRRNKGSSLGGDNGEDEGKRGPTRETGGLYEGVAASLGLKILQDHDAEAEATMSLDPAVLSELDAKAEEMESLNAQVLQDLDAKAASRYRETKQEKRARILRGMLAPFRENKQRSAPAARSPDDPNADDANNKNDDKGEDDGPILLREWNRTDEDSEENNRLRLWWEKTQLGLNAAKNLMRRATVGVAGAAMVAVGVPLLVFPVPGPGVAMVVGGLYVLSTEFDGTQVVLDEARDKFADVLKIVGMAAEPNGRRLEGGGGDDSTAADSPASSVPEESLPAQELETFGVAKGESDASEEEKEETSKVDSELVPAQEPEAVGVTKGDSDELEGGEETSKIDSELVPAQELETLGDAKGESEKGEETSKVD